jgi:hypothetical protein
VSDEQLEDVQHAARREAAPAALVVVGLDLLLALTSAWRGWYLYSSEDWWVWLFVAAPALVLAAVFAVGGMGRFGVSSQHRREAAIVLLGLVAVGNFGGILLVVVSLLNGGSNMTGVQLLTSATVVLAVNVITFALIFWELDSGGPVRRALASERKQPDFQFPQDDNPSLAAPGWKPALSDYLYVGLTNSVAFSPTDTMPLSRGAKGFMGAESVIALVTLLIVGARAVNILGG